MNDKIRSNVAHNPDASPETLEELANSVYDDAKPPTKQFFNFDMFDDGNTDILIILTMTLIILSMV